MPCGHALGKIWFLKIWFAHAHAQAQAQAHAHAHAQAHAHPYTYAGTPGQSSCRQLYEVQSRCSLWLTPCV